MFGYLPPKHDLGANRYLLTIDGKPVSERDGYVSYTKANNIEMDYSMEVESEQLSQQVASSHFIDIPNVFSSVTIHPTFAWLDEAIIGSIRVHRKAKTGFA